MIFEALLWLGRVAKRLIPEPPPSRGRVPKRKSRKDWVQSYPSPKPQPDEDP